MNTRGDAVIADVVELGITPTRFAERNDKTRVEPRLLISRCGIERQGAFVRRVVL